MSLSQSTVELIFAKLSLAYGHRFLSIWDGTPLEVVKADWGETLASVRQDRILWALQHLPERAPDAPTFRALCARMPDPDKPIALPDGPKKPAPAIAKALSDAVHSAPASNEPERLRWARAYIAKWTADGATPTFTQRSWLAHAQRIVELHEAERFDIAQLKRDTEQRVHAHQQENA